ncbi:hypothetical protein [Methanocalculus sp. MC3]
MIKNTYNAKIPFELGVWGFCAIISIVSYLAKVDIGIIGAISWLVFLGGIGYCIIKALI